MIDERSQQTVVRIIMSIESRLYRKRRTGANTTGNTPLVASGMRRKVTSIFISKIP